MSIRMLTESEIENKIICLLSERKIFVHTDIEYMFENTKQVEPIGNIAFHFSSSHYLMQENRIVHIFAYVKKYDHQCEKLMKQNLLSWLLQHKEEKLKAIRIP